MLSLQHHGGHNVRIWSVPENVWNLIEHAIQILTYRINPCFNKSTDRSTIQLFCYPGLKEYAAELEGESEWEYRNRKCKKLKTSK